MDLDAFRANAVAEFGMGMFMEIGFELFPIALVIPYLFAVGTDGDDSPQGFDFIQCQLKFLIPGFKIFF
jgi:hypothetical protein